MSVASKQVSLSRHHAGSPTIQRAKIKLQLIDSFGGVPEVSKTSNCNQFTIEVRRAEVTGIRINGNYREWKQAQKDGFRPVAA